MLNELLIDVEPAAAPAPPPPVLLPEELRAECAARANLYRLLAGVFVEEPGIEFLASLRAPAAQGALAQAGVRFGDDFTQPDLAALADALAGEYTTMFVASGGFPPVESVRLTGRYQQAPHFDVREIYRRAGFTVGKGRFQVFDDHLGVELLFVAELLDRCVAALDRGDLAGYRATERDIKRFWTLHPGRWVRGYCQLVERATEHSLYREMARFLAGFADEEIAAMRLRVDDVDQGREVVPKSEVQVAFDPDEPVCNACPAGRESSLPAGAIPIAVEPRAS
jgi:TorA maturation chaperone TorD